MVVEPSFNPVSELPIWLTYSDYDQVGFWVFFFFSFEFRQRFFFLINEIFRLYESRGARILVKERIEKDGRQWDKLLFAL